MQRYGLLPSRPRKRAKKFGEIFVVISRVVGLWSVLQTFAVEIYFLLFWLFSVVGRGNVVSVPPNVGPLAAALDAKMGAFCGVAKVFGGNFGEIC